MSAQLQGDDYNPIADVIQVTTTNVSKGLEFPVVALPDVGHMPAAGEDEREAARVFYVAGTRATQRMVIRGLPKDWYKQYAKIEFTTFQY